MSDIVEALTDVVGTGAISSRRRHPRRLHPRRGAHRDRAAPTRSRAAREHRRGRAHVVGLAADAGIALTARGSGTGLSGACIPTEGGIVVSFERMNDIIEIDLENHVAVVQPGVTLEQLDQATRPHGLVYPVFPARARRAWAANVATNAGGMRAVKYGVTRHQVLGLEAVLGTGEVIRTGGKFVKATTGYDLTQLIVGFRRHARARDRSDTPPLSPAGVRGDRARAVRRARRCHGRGAEDRRERHRPAARRVHRLHHDGRDQAQLRRRARRRRRRSRPQALAYLVVVLEDRRDDRLDENTEELAILLAGLGALDVYVLPPTAGAKLIEAREKAFWIGEGGRRRRHPRHGGAPRRRSRPTWPRLPTRREHADRSSSAAATRATATCTCRCSRRTPPCAHDLIHDIFSAGMELGGAISGEHGIGTEKKAYVAELEDPAKLALMRRIKAAFDPARHPQPGHDLRHERGRTADERRPVPDPHADRRAASTPAS